MIGTNMLQMMNQLTSAPALRPRGRRRGALARLCATLMCAAALLSPLPLPAQGAPATTPAPVVPPPAVPSPLAPTEVPGAQQGTKDVGKQLFPNAPKNPLAPLTEGAPSAA